MYAVLLAAALASSAPVMFRNDEAHSGVYAGIGPRLRRVRWRFRAKSRFFSSPTVSQGRVFIGSDDGNVYALRGSDGTVLWKHATHGPVRSTPAVASDAVFTSSLDGNVYALSAIDGHELWHFRTEGERRFTAPGIHGIEPKNELMPDPFDVFLSSPAYHAQTIFVGSGDHHVYALDARNGTMKWTFTTGNVVHASPAVANGMVYIGSWDRNFYALDEQSGTVRWKYQTGDDRRIYNQVGIAGSAAVAGDTVYFGSRDSHLYALNALTGALKWSHDEKGSWVVGAPAVAANAIYFTTSDERKLFKLDRRTGRELWRVGYDAFSFSSPSVAGTNVYFGTFGGLLYGVNATSGSVVDRFVTDAARVQRGGHLKPDGSVDLDSFYADDTFENIVAGLDRIFAMGGIAGSPVAAGGTIYIADTAGVLYAIGS